MPASWHRCACRSSFFLRFELRQSKLPPYMITTHERIVAGEAMHHEAVRRSAVALDRKRTIFGAVSRPRHERFAVGYITTERFGDFVDRGKVTCWHGTGGERAGRSPGRSRSRLLI